MSIASKAFSNLSIFETKADFFPVLTLCLVRHSFATFFVIRHETVGS